MREHRPSAARGHTLDRTQPLSTACDHTLEHTGRSSLLRSWRSSLRLRVLQWIRSPHSGEAKSCVQRRPHGVPVSGTAAKTMINQVWNFHRSLLWLYTSSQVLTATCTSETEMRPHATTSQCTLQLQRLTNAISNAISQTKNGNAFLRPLLFQHDALQVLRARSDASVCSSTRSASGGVRLGDGHATCQAGVGLHGAPALRHLGRTQYEYPTSSQCT